jgi:DNA-binding MarR family transcriptional regulator
MTVNPKRLELDHFLPYLVNKLAARFSSELSEVYESRFGITIPEWRIITHLSQSGNVSVREIFERVAMDKSKVSRATARLEAAGFIAKEVNESDRRLVSLQLTRKGKELFNQIQPHAIAYEKQALARLTAPEKKMFREIIFKLLDE